MQVKKQWLEQDLEQQTCSKLGKRYVKALYYNPAFSMQSTSWKMVGWMKHKLESRLPGETSIISDMQKTPPLWQKAMSLLMKVKEESEKVVLKLNIQKTKSIASCPISSLQIDEEIMEKVTDFILGGPKITAGGDCSHEIKRQLLLERKAMTNIDSILKSREICFAVKGFSSQSYVFYSSHKWI